MKTYLLLLGSAIGLCFLAGCLAEGPCENTLIRQAKSPDGKLKAVVFSRGCGATTGQTVEVSILPATAPLPVDAGNVFYADESNVSVRWLGSSQLQITASGKAKVYKQETKSGAVSIVYK